MNDRRQAVFTRIATGRTIMLASLPYYAARPEEAEAYALASALVDEIVRLEDRIDALAKRLDVVEGKATP